MSQDGGRVLMIFVEPTPYILALANTIRSQPGWTIEIRFLGRDLSQQWKLTDANETGSLLPSAFWQAWKNLSALLDRRRIDILHLPGWGHPLLLVALVVASRRGIRVFVESDTPSFGDEPAGIKSLVKALFYPWLFRHPTGFLPGGTRQAEYLKRYGVSDDRIRLAHMTVDVVHIRGVVEQARLAGTREAIRARWGVGDATILFVFVGRLESFKGMSYLLESFRELREHHADVALMVVGEGSMRETVAMAAQRDAAILGVGRLSGDEVYKHYAAADVLILPSSREPWGLVVNEAMAAGLPVIVSDRVGSATDLVEGRGTGIVIPHDDVAALTSAMATLAQDQLGRERMAQAAKALIAQWDMRNWAKNIVSAWQTLRKK